MSMKLTKTSKVSIVLISTMMICVCTFLANHYHEVYFPTDFNSGNSCNYSSFWSCDKAIFSSIASVLNIPISFLGLFFSFFILITTLFPVRGSHTTNYFLAILNGFGCLFLLFYSIFFLGGLCPNCSIYYLLSFLLVGFYTNTFKSNIYCDKKILGIFLSTVFIYLAGLHYIYREKNRLYYEASQEIIDGFLNSEDLSYLKLNSEHFLTKKNENAPIKIIAFSDFECPSCKEFAQMIPRIKNRYGSKIQVQYVFFPMHESCNDLIPYAMHPHSCLAAQIAICSKKDFLKTHDFLYKNQDYFTEKWFSENFKTKLSCAYDAKTIEKIKKLTRNSRDFKIEATPTLIINGKKLEGLLPIDLMFKLFDRILTLKK